MTYYEDNKERLKTRQLEYYYNNKEKIRANQKEYQEKLRVKRNAEKLKKFEERHHGATNLDEALAKLSIDIFFRLNT